MKRLTPLLALFSILLLKADLTLSNEALPEDTIKAGYLYHFGQLTKWPEDALNGQLHYCVYGAQSVGDSLSNLDGKVIKGRDIAIREVERSDDLKKCNLLYLRGNDPFVSRELVAAVADKPVLTITDDDQLAKAGIAIHIKPQGERLVFSINNGLAKSANLLLSSKLLKLAK